MSTARPVIALITDFGLRDHYVGVVKGVALGICGECTFVDISHDIAAHDVLAAALELEAAYRYFPEGTIFLVVVDPGVGSTRRGIALQTEHYRFVAPDNGVLTLVEGSALKTVELTNPRYARDRISSTFEGRDRFAPAAAWLARGIELSELGTDVDAVMRLDIPVPREEPDRVSGEVLRVDRFGNLITNIERAVAARLGERVAVHIGGREICGVKSTYSDVEPGALCALIGSAERLEVAVNGASAAVMLGVGRGAAVQVLRGA